MWTGRCRLLAPQIGVHGIGFVAALLAFALSLLAPRSIAAVLALLGGAGGCGGAAGRLQHGGRARTRRRRRSRACRWRCSRATFPQDEKFQGGTGIPVALDWYGRQLQDSTASLVVAPETAIPLLPQQLPDGYLEALRARFAQGQQAALVGIPLGSFKEGYTNSVIGLKPGAQATATTSTTWCRSANSSRRCSSGSREMMNIPLGDFNRGAARPAARSSGRASAWRPTSATKTCSAKSWAARFADPATAPTIFVNVSNIAWFGNTVAIDQHLQISRMRALEFERPMIRATNTGATVIIDHRGRVTHSLPRHTRGVLAGRGRGPHRRSRPMPGGCRGWGCGRCGCWRWSRSSACAAWRHSAGCKHDASCAGHRPAP